MKLRAGRPDQNVTALRGGQGPEPTKHRRPPCRRLTKRAVQLPQLTAAAARFTSSTSSLSTHAPAPKNLKEPATPRRRPEDTYTNPALRERLKEEIKAGDKGGAAGQWSARKSQLLASEYKKAGGGYQNDTPTDAQQHLDEWTAQGWQTADGQPARHDDGTTARYLPKEAWDELTPAQKKATNAKKLAGSRAGQQHVGNTAAVKAAREHATGGE